MYLGNKAPSTAIHQPADKCASSTEGMRALPAAIQYLRVAIENAEANQSLLHRRLELMLDPGPDDDSEKEGLTPAITIAGILDDLARRLNAVNARQLDLLDRLHV